MEKEILSNKKIEQISIDVTKKWYLENRNIVLAPPAKGELGFDLKYPDGSCYLEVKGISTGTAMAFAGRDLTKHEYKKLEECLEKGKEYNLVAVFTVGSGSEYVRIIPGQEIKERAKEIISYRIPFKRTEIEKWKPE